MLQLGVEDDGTQYLHEIRRNRERDKDNEATREVNQKERNVEGAENQMKQKELECLKRMISSGDRTDEVIEAAT